MRGWLGKHVPEEGVLVLLRGLLEGAAPEAATTNHLVTYGESIEGELSRNYHSWPYGWTRRIGTQTYRDLVLWPRARSRGESPAPNGEAGDS
jgi:hypothetical protein